jgi:hypothetical protein
VLSELVVLHNESTLSWLPPLLVVAGVLAIGALSSGGGARVRAVALAVALGVLMIAPASWAVQTLGHPTSGTFPAGGPVTASFGGPGGGGPGGGGGFRGMRAGGARGGFPGPPPGAPAGGFRGGPPGAAAGGVPGGPPLGLRSGGGPGLGGPGGRNGNLTQVLSYVNAHGGGTVGVSSQQGASGTIIQNGAKVAGLGGFTGRESEVSVSWLAQAVRSGQIRWVLTDGNRGGPGSDGRVGSSKVMAAVAATCTRVPSSAYSTGSSSTTTGSSGGALYDCQGHADALAAYGGGS